MNDNARMQLIESASGQGLQNIHSGLPNNGKKKQPLIDSDEVSEIFLAMLQKNMKLNHQNTLHETFNFLNDQSNVDSSFKANEIYKPENLPVDQSNYSQHNEYEEYLSTKDQRSDMDTKKDSYEVRKDTKATEKPQEMAKVKKEEPIEKVSMNDRDREHVKKPTHEQVDKTKATQAFDEIFSKLRKTSDLEVKKNQNELGEIKLALDGNTKDKLAVSSRKKTRNGKSLSLNLRSSSIDNNSTKTNAQHQHLNVQNNAHLKAKDQSLQFDGSVKQGNRALGLKNQLGQSSSVVRGEYSFSEATNTQNQAQNTRFSKLLQNPGLKDQLNEQFQSMLHRAKILIRDQKNASLNTRLHPKELGTVSLKLNMVDGNLNGLFTVENESIQKLIAERMDKILSDLREDGYHVTSFNVNVRSDHSSGQGGNIHDQRAPQQGWLKEEAEATPWEGDFGQKTGGEIYA